MYIEKEITKSFSTIFMMRLECQLDSTSLHMNRLFDACRNDRVKIFYSYEGHPIGYVAWANVTRETLSMSIKKHQMPFYMYEWNEGRIMLIFDVVFVKEWLPHTHYAFIEFIRPKRFFSYFKRNKVTICAIKNGGIKKPSPAIVHLRK